MDAVTAFSNRMRREPEMPGHDGNRLAIIVEGGGMRGAVSAAMLAELARVGVLQIADVIVGTSAGAVNAACAIVGQSKQLSDAYATTFTGRNFLNTRHIWKRGHIVKTETIVDTIDSLYGVGNLVGRVDFRPRLVAVATRVDDARAHALSDFTSRDDLLGCLKASSLLPILGGSPVQLRGHQWLDGGITEALPLPSAAAQGVTHAIVVATRPLGTVSPVSGVDRLVLRYLRSLNADLTQQYVARSERYRLAAREAAAGSSNGIETVLLAPSQRDILPSRTTRNQEVIEAAGRDAVETTRAFLSNHELLDSCREA